MDIWIGGCRGNHARALSHQSIYPVIQSSSFSVVAGVAGPIKNPRLFPAVGSCRNLTYRQAPTASFPTTTTTRATCRILSNIASNLSAELLFGQARIPRKDDLLLAEAWLLLAESEETRLLARHAPLCSKLSEHQYCQTSQGDKEDALCLASAGGRYGGGLIVKRVFTADLDFLHRLDVFNLHNVALERVC